MTKELVKAEQSIAKIETQKSAFDHWLSKDKILNADEFDILEVESQTIKALQKELEKEKKKLIQPLNAVLKQLRAKYKPMEDALDKVKNHMRNRLARAWKEKLQQEQIKKAETKAKRLEKKGDKQAAEATRQVAIDTPAVQSSLKTRSHWTAEVTSKTDFLKECLMNSYLLDCIEIKQSKINDLARHHKQKLDIPGLQPMQKFTEAQY